MVVLVSSWKIQSCGPVFARNLRYPPNKQLTISSSNPQTQSSKWAKWFRETHKQHKVENIQMDGMTSPIRKSNHGWGFYPYFPLSYVKVDNFSGLKGNMHGKTLCYLRWTNDVCGLNGVNGFCQIWAHLPSLSFPNPACIWISYLAHFSKEKKVKYFLILFVWKPSESCLLSFPIFVFLSFCLSVFLSFCLSVFHIRC